MFVKFSIIDGKFFLSNGEGYLGNINPVPIIVPGVFIIMLFIEGTHLLIAK